MAKYRSKPKEVEAEQFIPELEMFCKGKVQSMGMKEDGTWYYFVTTIHGQETRVVSRDWVITEPDGVHHYPCKPDIFEKTYEPA